MTIAAIAMAVMKVCAHGVRVPSAMGRFVQQSYFGFPALFD
jgi:tetrahydromethanopterin S-methyltransferase subunit E